ncbi:TRAP transporter large permease subunit [Marinobacter sp.]|uniref:TRAP transporter large permease subunit n=1 Tax=Marinobacter sp. TaxID=50741 RepID=UPI0039C939B8
MNILTSLFFSEISGTATSDAAAIGSVMIPQMCKRGYPPLQFGRQAQGTDLETMMTEDCWACSVTP